jgi:hypothetical protein
MYVYRELLPDECLFPKASMPVGILFTDYIKSRHNPGFRIYELDQLPTDN